MPDKKSNLIQEKSGQPNNDPVNRQKNGDFKKKKPGSISKRLIFAFIFLILSPLVVATGVSVYMQIQSKRTEAIGQLRTISTLKSSKITSLANQSASFLDNMQENVQIRAEAAILLTQGQPITSETKDSNNARAILANNFRRYIGTPPRVFDDIYLISSRGDLLASSARYENGQTPIPGNWEAIKTGIIQSDKIPLFLDRSDPSLPVPTIFVSRPVLDVYGNSIGILAGKVNSEKLFQVLGERTGLGKTGVAYLIGFDKTILTPLTTSSGENLAGTQLNNSIITETGPGFGNYIGPNGMLVFGVFEWIPEWNAILIVEKAQQEALAPVVTTILTSIIISFLALVFAIMGAILVARQIARPIASLASFAAQSMDGNLNEKLKVQRDDEIGILTNHFYHMADQLNANRENLEARVAERTAVLEERVSRIQLAGEIARDAASATDQLEVMNRAVNLIHDRFKYYHVGIFLVDEPKEYAVLRTATGEAGLAMLVNGHRLKIGETGMVGYVAAKGVHRIAQEVNKDVTHYKNPFLPQTRSELALPLKISSQNTLLATQGGKPGAGGGIGILTEKDIVIGVLDVQSIEPNAFDDEDVRILQTLADQLAVTIQKTYLLQQYRESVQELEATYRQYTGKAWHEYLTNFKRELGVRFYQQKLEPDTQKSLTTLQAMEERHSILKIEEPESRENGQGKIASLAVPIILRGHTLGVLTVKFMSERVNPETISLLENLSERLALALDNARLLEQIQRQAERDRTVSQIATKVRASTDIDTILRTAVQDLSRSLGVSQAIIQLANDDTSKEVV
jgi:GAF domain-containing protein/HAMP domain-containing protein